MALKITAILDGKELKLEESEGRYQISETAPGLNRKALGGIEYYPLTVVAQDSAGNKTYDNSDIVTVKNNMDFELIAADGKGTEAGYMDEAESVDIDIGDTNDFEIVIPLGDWDNGKHGYGNRIYVPGTEYGGIIRDTEIITKEEEVYLRGPTWRGLLCGKIIEPPEGEAYRILDGEINDCIRELISERFDGLFYVPEEHSGAVLSGWKVERYAKLYSELMKIAEKNGFKISIGYDQEKKVVAVRAAAVENYAEELEYSQDGKVDFCIRDCRSGVNHLICGGKGEGAERDIIHLYVQEDGSIGEKKYYEGLEEISDFYDYGNAEDTETLKNEGRKRLMELQNYKKLEMFVDNIDLDIGDIVAGREYVTGTYLQKPVIQKIMRKQDGNVTIEYKLKGEE